MNDPRPALVPISGTHLLAHRFEQSVLAGFSAFVPSSHIAPHHLVRSDYSNILSCHSRLILGFISDHCPDGSCHAIGQSDGGLFGLFALHNPPQPVITSGASSARRNHTHVRSPKYAQPGQTRWRPETTFSTAPGGMFPRQTAKSGV